MEKIKLLSTLYSNSINNPTDNGGGPLGRRLSQICFASQTGSNQIQTDLITNKTIERFIDILNSDNSAEFSKFFDNSENDF